MIEARAIIESIDKTRTKLESLGAEYEGDYAFKDMIFIHRNRSLSQDFLRIRVYSRNNWATKNVILERKQTKWKFMGKVDNVIIREQFDSVVPAQKYIEKNLSSEFEENFEFLREGWQYLWDNHRVFVEDIAGYYPTVELEAENEHMLKSKLKKIGYVKVLKKSVAEIMQEELSKRVF